MKKKGKEAQTNIICTLIFLWREVTEPLKCFLQRTKWHIGIPISSVYTQAQHENRLNMWKHVLLSTCCVISLQTCTDVCTDTTQRMSYSIQSVVLSAFNPYPQLCLYQDNDNSLHQRLVWFLLDWGTGESQKRVCISNCLNVSLHNPAWVFF